MANVRPIQNDNGTSRQVATTDTLNVSGLNAPSTPLTLDGNGRRVDVAGVAYTWPNAHGTAGAALVDTDGSGNLSWQVGGGSGGVTSVGASAPITTTGGTTPTIGLADSGVTANTYGTAASVAQVTVTAKGVVSAANDVSIQIAEAQVTNLTTDLASKVPTTTQVIAGTGLSGGGTLSSDVTLSMPNVGAAGTYGSASSVPVLTTDAQGRVSNVVDTSIVIGSSQITNAGVANGVATLDSSGTVPTSQLPAAVLGAVSYQGTWNASTNTPTLTSSVGTKGYYYVVSVAGSTNLNGTTSWNIGDWAIFNGTAWEKVDNTDSVTSVNGFTGAVSLTAADVSAVPTSRQVIAGTGLTGGGALSSDVTLSMPNVGTAGTYGSASQIPRITTDAQGRITAVSVFNPQFSTVSYLPSATQTITAPTQQFVVSTSLHVLSNTSGGTITMTASPLISASGVVTGQVLILHNSRTSTNTITVSRGALPGGSGVALGTASRQLTPGSLLSLIYDGTYWLETAFSSPTV